MTAWIHMRHEVHGGVARFPADVEPAMRGRGWARCPDPEAHDVPAEPAEPQDEGQETKSHRAARRGGEAAQE